jgi:hypothetical protein
LRYRICGGSKRQSLLDSRPAVVATDLRVWWGAASGGHAAAKNVAENVITLVTEGSLPTATGAPVYISMSRGLSVIRDGAATEDVALGLSTLGLLSETIERVRCSRVLNEACSDWRANKQVARMSS